MPVSRTSADHPPLSMVVSADHASALLAEQYNARTLLHRPLPLQPSPDRTYSNNKELWADILAESLYAEAHIALTGFRIFEWIPRSPGLYHTPFAYKAREEARANIEKALSRRAMDGGISRRLDLKDEEGRRVVYNPCGKYSMLKGGIGSIRLKPVSFPLGQYYFMGASSSLGCDDGLPIAVPDALYKRIIDQVKSKGSFFSDIEGELKFLPNDNIPIYSFSQGISHFYLLVSDIQSRPSHSDSIDAEPYVSLATTFLSDYEDGRDRLYATYVTFSPSLWGDKNNAIEWLEQVYVQGQYKGKIITDFDQQSPKFGKAIFSLDAIMTGDDPQNVYESLISVFTDAKTTNDWHSLERVARDLRRKRPVFITENYGKIINVIQSSDTVIAEGSNVATDNSTVRTN